MLTPQENTALLLRSEEREPETTVVPMPPEPEIADQCDLLRLLPLDAWGVVTEMLDPHDGRDRQALVSLAKQDVEILEYLSSEDGLYPNLKDYLERSEDKAIRVEEIINGILQIYPQWIDNKLEFRFSTLPQLKLPNPRSETDNQIRRVNLSNPEDYSALRDSIMSNEFNTACTIIKAAGRNYLAITPFLLFFFSFLFTKRSMMFCNIDQDDNSQTSGLETCGYVGAGGSGDGNGNAYTCEDLKYWYAAIAICNREPSYCPPGSFLHSKWEMPFVTDAAYPSHFLISCSFTNQIAFLVIAIACGLIFPIAAGLRWLKNASALPNEPDELSNNKSLLYAFFKEPQPPTFPERRKNPAPVL